MMGIGKRTITDDMDDEFKKCFKYFKRKNPSPEMSKVLDFRSPGLQTRIGIKAIKPNPCKMDAKFSLDLGITDPKLWEIFSLDSQPGLIFIRNPFTSEGQCRWINRALNEYPRKPHKSNLDPHVELEEWPWRSSGFHGGGAADQILYKLRWVTLGYHHNWDTKVYTESNKDPFPKELASLSRCIADVIGHPNFTAEAAIVNYYHLDSTLAGHTDHSEKDMTAPLISVSFGQSAIFLIGGRTKDTVPTPLFVRSGDIVIMKGESRQNYHAVPRILVESSYTWPWLNVNLDCNYSNRHVWGKYLKTSRININVRQVHVKSE